ncbi:PEGA domain-containing protein [Methanoculleus sp. Wushi-C6]|uniref:PEGA domain-containing protein n=1 Tax=Methanoculleus caldifontis TaxID=2651577 RepID=A0ABU3X105_9EURY|nr:PEGA domain-containing protein [Methanoculleus sp. Wushi-C6]MDV2481734.1 PEGA domain-containing protein [Methanoculleus sp. Wushi-C6]
MLPAHWQGCVLYPAIIAACICLTMAVPAAAAPTTELHIVKLAADGVTVLNETTVDYRRMEANLPVQGDGVTHYYHQGPVFTGDPWNPGEDTNVQSKDMGAVKGTDLADLCDLVGGMAGGETVKVRAADGMSKIFPYRNVYEPEPRQGPIVVTWYKADEGYVPEYYTGMRLVFFADTSTNPNGTHAFGVWDMHECFDPEYWYFFQPNVPTTTGLSVQYVTEIIIYSEEEPTGSILVTSAPPGAAVYIDDEETGSVTPCTLSGIETGGHSIRVEKEGFGQPGDVWVNVKANTVAEVEFNLTPETGSIAVSSVPTNASIYLDGNMTGFRTDTALKEVPTGEHTVELVMPGYRNATRTVTVEKDDYSIVDLVLSPENSTAGETTGGTGQIVVFSVPTNASIILDGYATGLWTNTTLDVPVGEHTIELVMPGYLNAARTVTVEESRSITLDLLLSPAGSTAGANATAGPDTSATGHPASNNSLEALIAAVFSLMNGLLSFLGMGESLPAPAPEQESAPAPDEGAIPPVPTDTPVPSTPTPADTRSVKNQSGGLHIESYPPGMTIVVDNKRLVWQTPHVVYGLREGLHSVTVEKSDPGSSRKDSDYQFETVQAWVYPDAIAPVFLDGVTATIRKTIRVDSEAYAGEQFTVNGLFPAGTIPGDATVEGMKPWITVLRDGKYLSFAVPSSIAANGTYFIKPWSGETVSVGIGSDPAGAPVFVDGFPTGERTPCRVGGLSPGRHRILVSMPGYLPAEEVITIPEGSSGNGGTITCTLREYTHGDLRIESTVPDAKIYLYGRYTGEKAPHTFPGMSIGTYEVRAVSENDSRTVEDMLVRPGETTRCMVALKEGAP